jgi:CheY-like chemotaxis protein
MRSQKPILLVEDDQVDAMMITRAMQELNINNRLDIVINGEEALAYLRDRKLEKPGLIFLDLNMPRMNGLEFLRIIKQDALLQQIPVIVLTTSREIQDRQESFKLSVGGYMVKPFDYCDLVEIIRVVDQYWSLSELPE